MARGSWFVTRKTMPHGPVMYIAIYSRRAALAGSAPTHKADGRVFLRIAALWQPTFISSPVCDIVGDVLKGVPLRAKGFPKRRCQFESVAAERRI